MKSINIIQSNIFKVGTLATKLDVVSYFGHFGMRFKNEDVPLLIPKLGDINYFQNPQPIYGSDDTYYFFKNEDLMDDEAFREYMNQVFNFALERKLVNIGTTAVRDSEKNQNQRIGFLDDLVSDWKKLNSYDLNVYLFISR